MYKKYIKRIVDFTLSLLALTILSPILLIIAILVRIKLGSPIIFKQKRPGLNGKIFTLYKFRTMTDQKDKDGNLLPDSERLTKFGKLLRSTSLDELPELINILKGEMSIVGPRPQLVKDMWFMTKQQRKRHLVRPGLTGLAQVNGRNNITWENKLQYDLDYIEKITLIKDIKIILKTVGKVFARKDIETEGMDTAEDLCDYLLRSGKITQEEYNKKIKEGEKMKIWLLQASEPMPIVNKGERFLRMGMIAEELSKRGHQITWFANTFDHFQKKQLYKKDTTIKVKENYSLELIHAIGYKRNISLSRIINHKVIAKKFKQKSKKIEKPDLIYASFPTIDYAEEAVKYGKKHNVPVIVDIRDLWPDIFKHNLPKPIYCCAYPYILYMDYKTKKTMKNAYAINSISDAMLNWGLKKANREKNKNDQYFYIGYNKQEDIKHTEKERDGLIDKNKFNISFFATINNQFDYEKIIELAKLVEERDKEIIINICGDGPQLKEFKEKANNISNIKFHGWVDKKKLNIILQNTDIGLAPYKNTFDFQMSVSNKFGEYTSFGLPVAIFSEGYMKELIEKNKCGISTQNMEEMCDFIINLKNNPKEHKNMSKNAIKLYKENFVADKIYKELANYLEKIKEEN